MDAPPPSLDPRGYALSKWMLVFQTREWALVLGVRNIRVNAGVSRGDDSDSARMTGQTVINEAGTWFSGV